MDNIMDENKKKKPKKAPRIKHKKLIILFTAILVVAAVFIIKAFSSKHYALAEETDSFEKERPTSGNPLDYSALDNAAICNWVIRHCTEFKSVTTGTVTAKVAVINYNQELKNTRIVTDDGCYIETISDSSLVHVYEEKYLENNQVVVRKNHSDKYQTITNDVFLENYGWSPREFQAYILNEETITNATIEQADGNYVLTLTLDPVKSVPKKQRETKQIGGAKGYPGYKEAVLTVTLTSDWTPIEVDTYEVYDIGMPGIGDVTCKCNMVELFEYGKFEIPDKALFKEHINDVATDLVEAEKDVIGYLQEIFGPLIQGNMNDFAITVDALDTKVEGKLNLNLAASGVAVNADVDDIFVSYKGNDVYLQIGENKYKVNINEVKKYLASDNSSASSAIDLNSIISQVQNAKIIKDGNNLTIVIELELMGIKAKANINATYNGDTYDFKDIYATVDVLGKEIILTMRPDSKYNYPTIDSSYQDISNIFFIIDEVKALINKPLEVELTTSIKDIDVKASALYNNGSASGNIIINDKYEINVYYNNETIYLTYNNLYFKFNINDIDKFMTEDISLGDIKISLRDILDVIKTLNITVKDEKAFDLGLDLAKFSNLLKDFKVSVSKTDSLDLVIENFNLKLSIKETEKEVLINPELEYNDISNVKWLVDLITNAIKYEAYSFDINATYKDLKLNGNIYLDKALNVSGSFDLTYKDYEFKDIKVNLIDNVIYANAYNIKVKVSIDEIMKLVGTTPEFDIDKLLENLMIKLDESSLSIGLDNVIDGLGNINVVVNNESKVVLTAKDINASIKLSETTKKDISINTSEYIDVKDLEWLIDTIKDVLEYEAYSFDINATYSDLTISGNVYLDKDLNVSAVINLKYKDYEFNDINVFFINNTIYVGFYNIKVQTTIDDILSYVGSTPEFDIYSLINGLYLSSSDSKLSVSADLTSILDQLGIINVLVSSNLEVVVSNNDINASIKLSETSKKDILINKAEYISIKDLDWLINDIKDAVNYSAYNFNISLTYKDLEVTGIAYLNKNLEVEAIINVNYSGLVINDIKLVYKNKDIYLSFGKTSIKFNIDDIDDVIARINQEFDLDISMDSLKKDINLNDILSSINLVSSENKLSVSVDLSSLTSLLGTVEVEVSKGLKATVKTTDILVGLDVVEANAKDVEMPIAKINKEEIDLLIDYAKQLKDIVEHWRYNIGFELHVNGYDVYARANIITFKPDKGLSLYGKVILVKGSSKYYIEASIIDNVAFLMFSQTITNFNTSNPINSTTTQYIKFKINFNELIDIANYAIDALGIDNDTIKMAITYLGTIVNTEGDFDELFNDIKEKASSIDLSLVNDIINFQELEITVDYDKLTITLGNNSEDNLQVFRVFRDNGVVKGLDVIDFEINNDILNGHFELLEDEDITSANYAGCLDLNGIGDLIKAALNNYNKGEIEINGSADLDLIGIKVAGVTIKAKVDFDYEGKIRAYIYLKVPKVIVATNAETEDYIYIENGMIYIKRVTQEGGFLGIGTKTVTATRKMSLSYFGDDALEQIIWIFNFGDTVANAIRDAEKVDLKIEEVLKSYSKSGNKHNVTLDGAKLVGSNVFGDIKLGLSTTTINEKLYLDKITISATIVSVISVDATLTVNNGTVDWSFFPSSSTLESYNTYTK